MKFLVYFFFPFSPVQSGFFLDWCLDSQIIFGILDVCSLSFFLFLAHTIRPPSSEESNQNAKRIHERPICIKIYKKPTHAIRNSKTHSLSF